jgi:hypothetical protein
MKKIIFTFCLALLGVATFASNNYKLNENQVDAMFAQSTDQTASSFAAMDLASSNSLNLQAAGDGSKSGYLLRAFFCSSIGLHRLYMGIGNQSKGKMIAYYLCIPVWGGLVGCVDFWSVIFKSDKLSSYSNNEKFCVFLGK